MADLNELQSSGSTKIVGSDSSGIESGFISSASNGVAGNHLLHTQTPDTTTSVTALGALNAAVVISMAGMSSVGFQINSGTLIGSIVPECSIDGGTTWSQASFYDPSNSTVTSIITFSTNNTTKIFSVLPVGGSSHVRVRISAYTSGTANSLLRASQVTAAAGAVTAAAFGLVSNFFITIPNNTPTLLLAANPNRKFAYISNNSSHIINIQFGNSTGLSGTTGLVVNSSSFYSIEGSRLYTGDIYGYSTGGSANISVTEGTP